MKKLIVTTLLSAAMLFAGENLLKNGNAESGLDGWAETQMSVCTEKPHDGAACFQTISKLPVVGTQIIPVDAAKRYTYRLWIRTLDDKPVDFYLLMRALDANKKPIPAQNVTIVVGTDTTLAAPCKATDTILYVKDASKFRADDAFSLIAFQTKADLSDLPNGNLSKGVVRKVENKDSQWIVTLDKPCGADYPAGTPIREHRFSAAFMYPIFKKGFHNTEWQKFEANIYRESKYGATSNEFWRGTKYVQVGINPRNDAMLYVDDIEFLMLDK